VGSAALRLAALCGAAAAGASRALRGLAGWAAGRAIAPNSLTGISLLLALCAAAWFSGGPGGDRTRGLIAMGGWLLVMTAAGRLAAFTQRQSGRQSGRPEARTTARTGSCCPMWSGRTKNQLAADVHMRVRPASRG